MITKIPTKHPIVFLTIDDGAVKSPDSVQLLAENDFPVSLFLTSNTVRDNPAFFKTFMEQGSRIENHTVSHNVNMTTQWGYQRQLDDIIGMQDFAVQEYGRKPALFRPPGGTYSAGLEAGADDYVTKPLDPFVLRARLLVARRVTTLHADLAHYRRVLSRQARTDPLTGLHNRLKLSEDLERLHLRSQRYEEQYSVAMCDVDNFKGYNDLYGHQAGDLALRAVAAALLASVRKSDGVYRFGGEEFLLVLPQQPAAEAKALMERALDAVRDLAIVHAGDPSGQLRLSAGISSFSIEHPVDANALLGEADAALYAAKAAGRNRVELAR